ncbi:MAG TPA: sigma-70 family RNA polymerase sigma factor [Solirubrobacterales bacterium]
MAARKRAAAELVARHGAALRRTARRYSLCAEDAEDAYQRALEILLTKAPTDNARELIRWTHTVTKHEALAVRRSRERLLGSVPRREAADGSAEDWVELIPSRRDGPEERVESSERIARSREALQALKPAELRALTLLAEGYSYAEIGEMTGFSATKVNRCLAEGRERFRKLVSGSEDGTRCRELGPLLSAVCDGEAGSAETKAVREHLRACPACRATMRAYRAAAPAAAALAPGLPHSRSLLERVSDLLDGLQARLPGAGGSEGAVTQVATAGAANGAGAAGLAKALMVCAGAAGGAAACVATGVAPSAIDPLHRTTEPTIERISPAVRQSAAAPTERAAPPSSPPPEPTELEEPEGPAPEQASPPEPPPVESGAVEYEPPPPEAAPPPPAPEGSGSGSAAGEFGP